MVGLSQELSKLKINNFQSIKKLILVSDIQVGNI